MPLDAEGLRSDDDPLGQHTLVTTRPNLGKGAFLRALRVHRDEAQFTRAIAAVAKTDSRFAGAFVALVLDVARSDSRHRANVERIGAPPPALTCETEHSLYDTSGAPLGRVDLRFDAGEDFTLLVENKLYSGFGYEQLERYQAALRSLPVGRARGGLIAVTRDVPSYGELLPGARSWLGGVRWARLYDGGLSDLPIVDPDIALQWKLFIEMMHEEGELGLTSIDSELIVAWSRYEEAQKQLVAILGDIRQPALDNLRDRLYTKYRRYGSREQLAGTHHFGRREAAPYKRERSAVWTAIRVPAAINHPTIRLSFLAASSSQPVFSVEVGVWNSTQRKANGDFRRAAQPLAQAGLHGSDEYSEYVFASEHQPEAWLHADDVPSRLLDLIDRDLTAIVESGVLAKEFDLTLVRGRNGPPRVKLK